VAACRILRLSIAFVSATVESCENSLIFVISVVDKWQIATTHM
jgi:hypothetical protein